MAFRSKETNRSLAWLALLLIALAVVPPMYGEASFAVRHKRSLWWDRPGDLLVSDEGFRFTPARTGAEEVPLLWEQIQQLTLSERVIEIVTYQDQRWQLGRDRHIRFVLSNTDTADTAPDFNTLESSLRRHLPGRVVRALAGELSNARWRISAKRTGFPRGVEGTLYFDGDELRFDSAAPAHSRRWNLQQIETIASTGPFALTGVAPERAVSDQGSRRSFEFQLKEPLTQDRYRELWTAIEAAHGTRLRFQESN